MLTADCNNNFRLALNSNKSSTNPTINIREAGTNTLSESETNKLDCSNVVIPITIKNRMVKKMPMPPKYGTGLIWAFLARLGLSTIFFCNA